MRRTTLVAVLLGCLAALPATAEAAGAKRVVALEWDYAENVLALGVEPVGVADLRGMRVYSPVRPPQSIEDVGTRQEPSLERIAALRPDLIIAPRYRVARNLDQLREIAKVLVLDPFPRTGGRDGQYRAMIGGMRAIAKAVGQRARGEAILKDLERTYGDLRRRLADAGRARAQVTFATGGGTAGSPAIRLFTRNSVAAGVLRRLGLRPHWNDGAPPFGFSTVGLEALRRIESGWLVFAYPKQFADVVRDFQDQEAWKRLAMVRENRVRSVAGNTWAFGGPLSNKVLAQRIAGALVR
jgi:iron complex transport system substrate-binding protein